MEANKIGIKTLIISIAAIVSIELFARVLISKTGCHAMAFLCGARLLQILLMILIVLIRGQGLSSIGLAPSKILPGLKKGLVWSAGFAILTSIAFVVLIVCRLNPLALVQTHLPKNHSDLLSFFFVGGMIAPVAEEILFRGIIYGFLRRWGVLTALILSTLIFVLAHPAVNGICLVQVVGGIVFAAAYESEGSLMAPITIHVLGNTAIFGLSMIG